MKKLQLMTLAAAMFAVVSCSDDDSSNNGSNVNANLEGTYELTAASSSQTNDYDGDGDSSADLVTEGSCFNKSWIAFHSDGTYDEGFTRTVASENGLELECETLLSSGTYTRQGETIITNRTSGTGEATATFTFDSSLKTLTRTDSDAKFAIWGAINNLWATATGSVNLTYKKYSNNSNTNGNGQNDADNVDTSAKAKLVGNFDLTSFLVGTAQDLDNNGQSSNNLVSESSCYSNADIKFNNDGTFTRTIKTATLGSGSLSLECETETETGTYTRVGDKVITRHMNGDVRVNTTYDFNASATTVSRSVSEMSYPIFNAITSLFGQVSGNVVLTYSKG